MSEYRLQLFPVQSIGQELFELKWVYPEEQLEHVVGLPAAEQLAQPVKQRKESILEFELTPNLSLKPEIKTFLF